MTTTHPRPGTGVIIQNTQGEVLLGLRQGSHASGEWGLPGGGLDFGETIFECAIREAREEVGLEISDLSLVSVSDELKYIPQNNKHYVCLGIKAGSYTGEPKLMEPEKCSEWRWFSLTALPANILEGSAQVLTNYRDGIIYRPAR